MATRARACVCVWCAERSERSERVPQGKRKKEEPGARRESRRRGSMRARVRWLRGGWSFRRRHRTSTWTSTCAHIGRLRRGVLLYRMANISMTIKILRNYFFLSYFFFSSPYFLLLKASVLCNVIHIISYRIALNVSLCFLLFTFILYVCFNVFYNTNSLFRK